MVRVFGAPKELGKTQAKVTEVAKAVIAKL
jgi:hypothetical protein